MKNTPTPWKINQYDTIVDSNNKSIICKGIGFSMGENAEAEANQYYIVKAVNSHEELIKQNEVLKLSLKDCANTLLSVVQYSKDRRLVDKSIDSRMKANQTLKNCE